MIIKLIIDDKERTFNTGFISGKKLRDTMAMSEEMEGKQQDTKTLDEMVDYVVDLYKDQFTRDQFYEGTASDKVISTFTDCIESVTGNLKNKSELIAVADHKPKNS